MTHGTPTIDYAGQYEVAETTTGPRCRNHGHDLVRHANAASIRECYRLTRQMQADMDAEIAAELAYERHLEDRGYWDARAQEDYEARMGVVQFEDAYAAAMA